VTSAGYAIIIVQGGCFNNTRRLFLRFCIGRPFPSRFWMPCSGA